MCLVVVVFCEAAGNFAAFIDDEIQSVQESILKQELFGRTDERTGARTGADDGCIARICRFAVGEFELAPIRLGNRLFRFGVCVRIRFVSVHARQEQDGFVRDRAMFCLDGDANERAGVVELPGDTSRLRLVFRGDRERTAPDDLVQIRVGDVAGGSHGLVRPRKCKG